MVSLAYIRRKLVISNEYGFTMLEYLFGFTVFLLIVPFFSIIIGLLYVDEDKISYETDLFFEHLRMEIIQAQSLEVHNDSLIAIMNDGTRVSFVRFEKNIRRIVNGAGNEILIQNVSHIAYHLVNNGVVVTVAQGGKKSSKRLSMTPLLSNENERLQYTIS